MAVQIEKVDLDEILKTHTESYVEKFAEWKVCVNATNELISFLYKYEGEYFTYDEFCKEFNESIIEYLTISDEMPTPDREAENIIHEILMQRVQLKLS